MKYCAVICEYNPFHSGHAYQLDRAVKETAADGVIAVMSGSFVQRAEPAVVDEFLRAECALRNGADMVIELPVAIATAAGRDFARGAVNIVAALPDVKFLVMGCEDETHIATLADVQFTESESFKAVLKSALDAGASYPSAYTTATAVEAEKRGIDRNTSDIILKKPNNLLCIEYIKALKSLGSDIEPVLIKRRGSDYNDKEIGTGYASASAIREVLLSNPYAAQAQMPSNIAEAVTRAAAAYPVRRDVYDALVIDAIRRADTASLRTLRSVGEGLEYKLKEAADTVVTVDALCQAVKSKRYTMSRVRRIALECLLDITAGSVPPPCRVLGVREEFKHYLARLGGGFYVSPAGMDNLAREQRASSLYALITGREGNVFYSTRLVTV